MEVGKLTVHLRRDRGKGSSRKLRSQGLVPGTCYGKGLDQPLNITVDPKALKASLDPTKRRNTVISVTVDDAGTAAHSVTAMLWEFQIDPLRRTVTHVDLKSIDPEEILETEVPIELIGKAKGLIDGGQIHVSRHDVTVRCKPADIPPKFELDVSPLEIGDTLHVSDITFPEGVTPAVSIKLSVVSCVAPKAEKTTEEELLTAEGVEGVEGAAVATAEGEKKEGGDKKEAGGDKKEGGK